MRAGWQGRGLDHGRVGRHGKARQQLVDDMEYSNAIHNIVVKGWGKEGSASSYPVVQSLTR